MLPVNTFLTAAKPYWARSCMSSSSFFAWSYLLPFCTELGQNAKRRFWMNKGNLLTPIPLERRLMDQAATAHICLLKLPGDVVGPVGDMIINFFSA